MTARTRDTSREAYATISHELSEKQGTVLGLLKRSKPLTNSEIAARLGWPINTVTPRTNELVKLGRIADMGKRPCRITGRTAHVWGVMMGLLSEELAACAVQCEQTA